MTSYPPIVTGAEAEMAGMGVFNIRERLAAYVREHLPEVWDGDHFDVDGEDTDVEMCAYCGQVAQLDDLYHFTYAGPCNVGTDFTRNTDVLLRMLFELGIAFASINTATCRAVAYHDQPDRVEKFKQALLAAVLAAPKERS